MLSLFFHMFMINLPKTSQKQNSLNHPYQLLLTQQQKLLILILIISLFHLIIIMSLRKAESAQNHTHHNPSPQKHKKLQIPTKLYRYQFQKGIIYNQAADLSLNIPQYQQQINGYTRILFKNGTFLEGHFTKGQAQKATLFGNYYQISVTGKFSFKKQIHGDQTTQYDSYGQPQYTGSYLNCCRHGEGREDFYGGYLKGNWSNGKKNGLFYGAFKNYSIQQSGTFYEDMRIGKWTYKSDSQKHQIDFDTIQTDTKNKSDNNTLKEQISQSIIKNQEVIQKQKLPQNTQKIKRIDNVEPIKPKDDLNQTQKCENPFNKPTYCSMLTSSSYQAIKKYYRMFDDSIISSWAVLMQYYLAKTLNDKLVIFTIDLLKKYAGINLQGTNYKNVRNFTKHFSSGFSLFTLVNQQSKTLLFPILQNAHFTLGVVTISQKQSQFQIEMRLYDSLRYLSKDFNNINPKDNKSWKAIRQYLLDELQNNGKMSQKSGLVDKIRKMSLTYAKCPSQGDGISCGVFVCLLIHYFCLGEQKCLPESVSTKQLGLYRKFLYQRLFCPKIGFQEIKFWSIKKDKK